MRFLRSNRKVNLRDEEIISAYKRDPDPEYIGILFERYSHLVFAVSMNYLKDEEESKDTVLSIFEKLGQDLQHYEIRKFSNWLHSVTRNHCLKELNRKKNTLPLKDMIIHIEEPEDSFVSDLSDVHLDLLQPAIQNLNDEQRICIQFFFLEGKSYEEISQNTGYSYNQVKSYIQNGKRNLKNFLENRSNEKK